MSSILELRVYTLRPGLRPALKQRFEQRISPMLERFGIEVVSAGPSLHDEVSFHLIRRFPTLAERDAQLARFYGSQEWIIEHEAEIMEMIETYSTCVVEE